MTTPGRPVVGPPSSTSTTPEQMTEPSASTSEARDWVRGIHAGSRPAQVSATDVASGASTASASSRATESSSSRDWSSATAVSMDTRAGNGSRTRPSESWWVTKWSSAIPRSRPSAWAPSRRRVSTERAEATADRSQRASSARRPLGTRTGRSSDSTCDPAMAAAAVASSSSRSSVRSADDTGVGVGGWDHHPWTGSSERVSPREVSPREMSPREMSSGTCTEPCSQTAPTVPGPPKMNAVRPRVERRVTPWHDDLSGRQQGDHRWALGTWAFTRVGHTHRGHVQDDCAPRRCCR